MATRERLVGIDALRGAVMVLMALDHSRDFFGDFRADPTDLWATTPGLFFTRWVTHFCAPVFVFLAGTGAWLYGAQRRRAELARFLLSRGLWLVLLEFTVVSLAWSQLLGRSLLFFQVIGAIGVSMVALGGLCFAPTVVVGLVGALLVAGHNALDALVPGDLGVPPGLWSFLLEPGRPLRLGGFRIGVMYPVLPWLGVMLLGYAFGPWTRRSAAARRRAALGLGTLATLGFAVLRASNLYGDPTPWSAGHGLRSLLSFLSCEKYPPSLCYVLMTLGPALVALAALDREGEPGRLCGGLATLGRVPLFYYVAHLYLLAFGAQAFFAVFGGMDFAERALPLAYAAWLVALLLLCPACAWYAGFKRRHRGAVWSYL